MEFDAFDHHHQELFQQHVPHTEDYDLICCSPHALDLDHDHHFMVDGGASSTAAGSMFYSSFFNPFQACFEKVPSPADAHLIHQLHDIDHHQLQHPASGVFVDPYHHCYPEADLVDEDWVKKPDPTMKNETRNKNRLEPKRKRIVHKRKEIIKGQWTREEDGLLIELVEKHGVRKWSAIAQMLPGRIGKQCRERWHNHLKPDIKKDRWSEEEDMILIEAHRRVGNKWAEIARSLPGRSENTIKNHWNATKRRQLSLSCRKSTTSKSVTPLQNYIRSLLLLSKDKDADKGSRSYMQNSTPTSQSNNSKNVDAGKLETEEAFHMMDEQMELDLQKEMDFMQMLSSYGGYINV